MRGFRYGNSDESFFEIASYDGMRKFFDHLSDGHYHNYYEIFFLLSGCAEYYIDNRVYKLKPKELVFIPTGIIHKAVYPIEKRSRLLLSFSKEYINPILWPSIQRVFASHFYRPKDAGFIEEMFRKIQAEYPFEQDSISHELIKAYMTEFLSYVVRHPSLSDESESNNVTDTTIEGAIRYINANYDKSISLEDIAATSGYSMSYFSKRFKETTGMGYKEYLTSVRIQAAKQLLSSTTKSISEICFLCGFTNSNHFSTKFKQIERMSPTQWRNMYNYQM